MQAWKCFADFSPPRSRSGCKLFLAFRSLLELELFKLWFYDHGVLFSPQGNEWKIQVMLCTLHGPLFPCLWAVVSLFLRLYPFRDCRFFYGTVVHLWGPLRSSHGLRVATWFFMVDLHQIPYRCCLDPAAEHSTCVPLLLVSLPRAFITCHRCG